MQFCLLYASIFDNRQFPMVKCHIYSWGNAKGYLSLHRGFSLTVMLYQACKSLLPLTRCKSLLECPNLCSRTSQELLQCLCHRNFSRSLWNSYRFIRPSSNFVPKRGWNLLPSLKSRPNWVSLVAMHCYHGTASRKYYLKFIRSDCETCPFLGWDHVRLPSYSSLAFKAFHLQSRLSFW